MVLHALRGLVGWPRALIWRAGRRGLRPAYGLYFRRGFMLPAATVARARALFETPHRDICIYFYILLELSSVATQHPTKCIILILSLVK